MAKKTKLLSGLQNIGIAPNLLMKDIENTAPFLFQGEIKTSEEKQEYLQKLRDYKTNSKLLKQLNLSDYFHLCISAHWTTAGTFVPTDVDNQIRYSLWKHPSIKKNIIKMKEMTIDSLTWDYSQVSERKCFDREGQTLMSTHEGTWFSVAIGAYCALKTYEMHEEANEVAKVILQEIKSEEAIMLELREKRDHINFLRAAPLLAHNFGDLDRVMVQWEMHESDDFCKSIYRLGHELNDQYSAILVYGGQVNKAFTSKENHRHMALRRPKSLRKSYQFLIPVGPFMDQWGAKLVHSKKLNEVELADIITALYEGYQREEEAIGYTRALSGILKALESDLKFFEPYLPSDLFRELKTSEFYQKSQLSEEEFIKDYQDKLEAFNCPLTKINF